MSKAEPLRYSTIRLPSWLSNTLEEKKWKGLKSSALFLLIFSTLNFEMICIFLRDFEYKTLEMKPTRRSQINGRNVSLIEQSNILYL
jgi:hypothetical protein